MNGACINQSTTKRNGSHDLSGLHLYEKNCMRAPSGHIKSNIIRMKKLMLIFYGLTLFQVSQTFGQNCVIRGKVTDRNEVLPFVNVILFKMGDTMKMVKGTLTDMKGDYILNRVDPGKYFLKFSSIGYHTKKSNIELQIND